MKSEKNLLLSNRRQIIKAGLIAGTGLMAPWRFLPASVFAAAEIPGLSDPALQPKFDNPVPDAMAPWFKYIPDQNNEYAVRVDVAKHYTGLIDPKSGKALKTHIWGYGDDKDGIITWPGRTFEVQKGFPTTVNWINGLDDVTEHLLPVDTNLHWCYALPGYTKNTIKKNGVPIIAHLHGGHTDFQYDGNPEFFYGPKIKNKTVIGPQWDNVEGGFTSKFIYSNTQSAGNLWYHDHALGITRLNVYAGLAGFYFIRDPYGDSGIPGNTLDLPAWPYEKAYAIQDRMFKKNGELFYPAFYGDPAYEDFIIGEGAVLPKPPFPVQTRGEGDNAGDFFGGPTALAEFFGDHMVVNGVIWPYEQVEPRNYRMHLLNGTDSRFMAIELWVLNANDTDFEYSSDDLDDLDDRVVTNAIRIPFTVIGSDQGLASSPTIVETLLSEPGSRYDIIVDFGQSLGEQGLSGRRVIMKNIGGDEPFGDGPGDQIFECTDRIMAFDVNLELDELVSEPREDVSPTDIDIAFGPKVDTPTRIRRVALFEGTDEYGRLQPLLGTAELATDFEGKEINWPVDLKYSSVGLVGQMEGSIAWHSPTTENPALGSIEEWEIWNMTGDAHPIHLHLVHFEVLERENIVWDPVTEDGETDFGRVADPEGMPGSPSPTSPAEEGGTYLVVQPTVQHNSVAGKPETYGMGFKIANRTLSGVQITTPLVLGDLETSPVNVVENTPKDMVTALPGQVTRIKAHFDEPGRYVWHCHILSHEDHEMMRVMHVTDPNPPLLP